ncbi:hypothetical protein GCM10010425_20160 [Streptomyces spororaveus]|uniref:Uncharacterized protein n=1 Tax=Streptomyces spororaveus TaxID=284039 RepID=A0ABQ3T7C5_9ACTN|nr:hypothetical protein Sspor_18520 [Streptomyces spororaveus]
MVLALLGNGRPAPPNTTPPDPRHHPQELMGALPAPGRTPLIRFVLVRVAVRPRDPRFLGATPDLAAAVAAAVDDGQDALDSIGHDWTEIKRWAQHLLPKRWKPWSSGSGQSSTVC